MTRKRLNEIKKEVRKQIKIIRNNLEFESMTFTYHPDSEQARREVAGYVPELLKALDQLVPKQ